MMQREISIAFQTNKRAADYIALARQVNQYDFDAVTVYCDAPFHPSYGPLLLMAPHITRARLGAAAISPSRIHPIDIAASTALLADVAQGGTYVGLARGAWLAANGIIERKPGVQAVQEAAEILRYLLGGRTGGYRGEVFQLAETVSALYPLPDAHIPLLIGSWGPKLCAVAGRIADEVKVGGSANPDIVPVIRSYIAVGEQEAGRETNSVGVVMGAVCVVDDDRDAARRLARREVALYLPVVAELDPTVTLDPALVEGLKAHAANADYTAAARLVSDDLLERFAFAGNPNDIIRQCEALYDAGTHRIELGTPHGLQAAKGLDLIGKRVLPALSQ